MTPILLYCDLVGKVAYKDAAGTAFNLPVLTGGENISLALRFLEQNGSSFYPVSPAIAAIRASVGLVDVPPASGSVRLKIGGGAQSNGVNTTAALPWNPSDNTIAAAINALSGLSGANPCTVVSSGESFLIRFADGSQQAITAENNRLFPTSFVRVRPFLQDGVWIHELTLVQAPVSSTSTFTTPPPDDPSIVLTQHGGIDPSGVNPWPTIQTLYIPPTFTGTYQIVSGYKKSAQLSTADDVTTIQAAINAMLNVSGETVTVSNPADYTAEITFDGASFIGTDVALMAVAVVTAPPGDPTIQLNLNTAEVYALLRTSDPSSPLVLEIEADLYIDPSDHTAGTTPVNLLRFTAIIQRPLQWEGLASAASIDWLRPNPVDYIPYTNDQILTGSQQAFASTIGDGAATSFVLDHNLGCNLVTVLVREHMTNGRLLAPSEYTVHLASSNSITLSGFATTPTAAQYDVLVVGVGPASVFQAHTHTISQIVGLQTIIDSYGESISTLQSILPTVPGAGVSQSGTGIVIPIQQISEIIGYRGVAPTPDPATGLKDSQLPSSHLLTPQSKFDRELWRVAVNPQMLALGRKITADWGVALQLLKANCAAEYKMCVEIGTYADQFTAGHFIVGASYKILTVGTTDFTAIGASANTVGISFVATGVGSGTGTATTNATLASTNSLLNVVWNTAAPVFTQPLFLTNEQIIHSFGLVISRGIVSGVETYTLSQMLYGILSGNNAAAPASANFAMRARLIDLETESVTPAKGWISYGVVPSITPLSAGGTGCQAVIST